MRTLETLSGMRKKLLESEQQQALTERVLQKEEAKVEELTKQLEVQTRRASTLMGGGGAGGGDGGAGT